MSTPGSPAIPPFPTRGSGWSNAAVLRTLGLTALFIGAVVALWRASAIVRLIFLGNLFGRAVARGARRLERRHLPRAVAAPVIVLLFAGLVGGILSYAVPRLARDTAQIQKQLPGVVVAVRAFVQMRAPIEGRAVGAAPRQTVPDSGDARAGAAPDTGLRGQLRQELREEPGLLMGLLSESVEIAAGVLLMLVLAIYIGAEDDVYRRGVLSLFPAASRSRALQVLEATDVAMSRWLTTQGKAMLALGASNLIVLSVLGVHDALALALIAGLLEFIPTFGALISGALSFTVAYVDSPAKAVWVLVAVIIIYQLEGNVLIPFLMRGALELPPALTIVTQAAMSVLFGFPGMLVAVPFLATVVVPIRLLYIQDHLGGRYNPAPAP